MATLTVRADTARVHARATYGVDVGLIGYRAVHVFKDVIKQVEYKDIVETIDHDEFLDAIGIEEVKEWLTTKQIKDGEIV